MPKWIEFVEYKNNKKTKTIAVFSKHKPQELGWIKWYGPFRKYSFFASPSIVFEKTCLLDIIAKIDELMDERKKAGNKITPGP